MRTIRQLTKHQRGDTIIEVLVAIAVCGSMLGSAYAIVNRTTKSQQQSTEHTEALKIAEGQLEALRTKAKNNDLPVLTDFCINSGVAVAAGDAACKGLGAGNRYEVTVKKYSPNTFEATVTWDGINGGTDSVGLTYKVYAP